MPVMPVPVLKETEQDVVHESLSNCFRTFGTNLRATGYHVVHAVCDIGLDFVIQSLARLF